MHHLPHGKHTPTKYTKKLAASRTPANDIIKRLTTKQEFGRTAPV
jgi:hypothetical protein